MNDVNLILGKIDELIDVMKIAEQNSDNFLINHWYSNLEYSKAVKMKDADIFNLGWNIRPTVGDPANKTFSEGKYPHECGTAACFIGWCAMKPEIFKLIVERFSAPIDILYIPPNNIKSVLNYVCMGVQNEKIIEEVNDYICDTALHNPMKNICADAQGAFTVYGKLAQHVTPTDVINRLYKLKNIVSDWNEND